MKLQNTGRSAIILRYGTHTKGKKGDPGNYENHNVLLDPGSEASLPDNLDHIGVDKVDRPKTRRERLGVAVKKAREK